MKKILLVLVCLAMVFSLSACFERDVNNSGDDEMNNNEQSDVNNEQNNVNNEVDLIEPTKYKDVETNPVVTMEMENGGIVKIELYPQIAPATVENFIYLINQGFYDGLTFHRVIPEFMAQGGDPSGDGTGGPGYGIVGEFKANGYKNELKHDVGVISMARATDNNSAGSQIFIVTDENSYKSLDGMYAGFGKVIEGMDVVFDIVNTEVIRRTVDEDIAKAMEDVAIAYYTGQELTEEQIGVLNEYYRQSGEIDRPVNPPVIKSMTVDTFGVEYDEPEKLGE